MIIDLKRKQIRDTAKKSQKRSKRDWWSSTIETLCSWNLGLSILTGDTEQNGRTVELPEFGNLTNSIHSCDFVRDRHLLDKVAKKKTAYHPFCAMNRLSIANNKLKFVSKGMQSPFHDVWCSHGMISYQGWADGRRTVCKHARSLLTASFRNHWSKNITMLQQGGKR